MSKVFSISSFANSTGSVLVTRGREAQKNTDLDADPHSAHSLKGDYLNMLGVPLVQNMSNLFIKMIIYGKIRKANIAITSSTPINIKHADECMQGTLRGEAESSLSNLDITSTVLKGTWLR